MAIKIEKESPDMYANTGVYEHCYFCNWKTDTWNKETNQPVCSICAKKRDQSELPKCTPTYKPKSI